MIPMNMTLRACVPVKPYLLKFIRHIENLEENQPLNLNNGGVVGYILKGYLTTKLKVSHKTEKKFTSIQKEYTSILWFEVNEEMKQFNTFYIDKSSIVAYNSFLLRLFHEFLLDKIRDGKEEGVQARTTIMEFMEKFGIDEEIDLGSLKKANYRLRLAKKLPIFQ